MFFLAVVNSIRQILGKCCLSGRTNAALPFGTIFGTKRPIWAIFEPKIGKNEDFIVRVQQKVIFWNSIKC